MNTFVLPRLLALAYLSSAGDKQAQQDLCDLLETIGHDSAEVLHTARCLTNEIASGPAPEWLVSYRESGARVRRGP